MPHLEMIPPRWGKITVSDILTPIGGELASGNPHTVIGGLSTDSRKIHAGDLFLALKGETYDGHHFVEMAFDKGACGAILEGGQIPDIPGKGPRVLIMVRDTLRALGDFASWWRHGHEAVVAVITGSAGKTTTKDMTESILGLGAPTLKNEGNLNNLIGLPLTLLTQEVHHRRVVLEMGMNRPGEIRRLTEIADPDIGLITNVAKAHLEGVGDIRGVARAKVELLEKISPDAQAILNGDDELLLEEATPWGQGVITFGLGSKNHIRASHIRHRGQEGVSFFLQREGGPPFLVELGVPGIQNVYNALAASAIAFAVNEGQEGIVQGLSRFRGAKGRFSVITAPGGVTIIDDTYNSNPSSLKAALDTLMAWGTDTSAMIVALGDMLELGREAAMAHREAGYAIAALNPRCFVAMGSHAFHMIEGARERGFPSEMTILVRDHEGMIEVIKRLMKKGDLILLKGSRRMRLEKVVDELTQGLGPRHVAGSHYEGGLQ